MAVPNGLILRLKAHATERSSASQLVASNLSGYANVARAGQDAVLVAPDDSAALAGALSSVLGDEEVASRLVASGIERAAGYSMTALADLYLDLYDEAIAKSGA